MINAQAKSDERAAFSGRLKQALAEANINVSITKLARTFNLMTQGQPVTVHAVRKWLVGEAIPTQEKIQELASMTYCDPSWLRYGTEPDSKTIKPKPEFGSTEVGLIHLLRRLPGYQQTAIFNMVDEMVRKQ